MTPRKVALVTGGSMGLGKAVAEHLALTDYEVITCARSGEVTYRVDVSSILEVNDMTERIEELYGRIDVLVNNAAIYGPIGQLDAISPSDWIDTLRTNLFGPMLTCRFVLPMMRKQGHGKIINVSGAGVSPKPECTAYNASKAGLLRFTEALAVDLAGTGIDVNSVAPGTLDTRMRLRSALPEDPERAMRAAVAMISWLASRESDGITGRLFSAVWDDIGNLPLPLTKDDFRMRRVVPDPKAVVPGANVDYLTDLGKRMIAIWNGPALP
jgi:3-oxoacyl-[acyl-carrier protein] reductase